MNLDEKIDIILKAFFTKGSLEVFDNIYNSIELPNKSDGDQRRLKSKMQEEGLLDCTDSDDMVFIITNDGIDIVENGGWLKYLEQIETENSHVSELVQIEEEKLRRDAKLSKWKTWTFWIGFTFAILASGTSLYLSLARKEPKTDATKKFKTYESKWNQETASLEIVRTNADSAKTITEAIERFNKAYQRSKYPFVRLIKVNGDTAYIFIDNSNYLTQQMGTTGADEYLATLTFSLTELSRINYLNLDFIEGDHAVPGTYQRTDFNPNDL
jgi:hypothetical protein